MRTLKVLPLLIAALTGTLTAGEVSLFHKDDQQPIFESCFVNLDELLGVKTDYVTIDAEGSTENSQGNPIVQAKIVGESASLEGVTHAQDPSVNKDGRNYLHVTLIRQPNGWCIAPNTPLIGTIHGQNFGKLLRITSAVETRRPAKNHAEAAISWHDPRQFNPSVGASTKNAAPNVPIAAVPESNFAIGVGLFLLGLVTAKIYGHIAKN